MQDIISLYRHYNKFNQFTDEDFIEYLKPSIELNQYKKHYLNNKLIGFTNWAFLSDKVHNTFKQTGIINNEDWKSGNHLWLIETICKSHLNKIMKWTKSFYTKQFGICKQIHCLRIKDNKIVRVVTRTTKQGWL